MNITIDTANISDAGFDRHLFRQQVKGERTADTSRALTAENLVGGIIGKEGQIYLGDKNYIMDGDNSRTVVRDGGTNRILFGRRNDGTYGLDICREGFDVFTAYEGEMLFSSSNTDDWVEYNPSNFSYNTTNVVNVANITPADHFQAGDRIKLVQAGTTKYFYIIQVTASTIRLNAGTDYSYTNNAITSIYWSRDAAPAGFPDLFSYDPNAACSGATGTIREETAFYSMMGNTVTIGGDFVVEDTPVSPDSLVIDIPFPVSASSGNWSFGCGCSQGSVPEVAYGILSSSTDDIVLKPASFNTGGWTFFYFTAPCVLFYG